MRRNPDTTRRGAFWVYAVALFTLTHWPELAIEAEIERPDLVAHAAAFGLWTALLIWARFFGPALSGRNLAACLIIAPVYAVIDESLQLIPVLGRHAAVDDALANALGIALALVIAGALALRARPRGLRAPAPDPTDT